MKPGIKNDRLDNKPRWELLPMDAVEKIVEVLTYGATKYADHNWKMVDGLNDRYYAALMRHLVASRNGEKTDADTGMSHLAHAACNAIFLLWNEINNGITDKK